MLGVYARLLEANYLDCEADKHFEHSYLDAVGRMYGACSGSKYFIYPPFTLSTIS